MKDIKKPATSMPWNALHKLVLFLRSAGFGTISKNYVLIDWVGGPDERSEVRASWPRAKYRGNNDADADAEDAEDDA